jgi:hypothetical protein
VSENPFFTKFFSSIGKGYVCMSLLLGFFSLSVSLCLYADDQEAAVATADAAIDDVVNHTINTEGFNEAKSISENDGAIVLNHTTPTIQVVKKPDEIHSQKKSEFVEIKPALNTLHLSIETEKK